MREADAIFIRTPKYSRDILVGGGKAPFSKDDPRLRDVPFPTRRPTLSEVKRVHSQLASLYKIPLSALVAKEKPKRKSPQVKKKPSPVVSKRQVDAAVEFSDEEVNSPPSEVVVEKSRDEKVSKKSRRKKPAPPQDGNIVCLSILRS